MDAYIKKTDAAHIAIDSALHDAVWCAARIRALPPADVRPVVRGRWVVKNSDGSWRVDVCSCCKKEMHYINYAPAYAYCPNCGAEMESEQEKLF